jgi:hypothetical protein
MGEKERKILIITFAFITLLTALVALGANIGLFGEEVRQSKFASGTLAALLAEVVCATIAVFKGEFLPKGSGWIWVNLDFEGEDPDRIELDESRCTYRMKDSKGNLIKENERIPILLFDYSTWRCRFSDVKPGYTISLNLIEKGNSRMWRVRPFRPLVNTQKARVYQDKER